MAQVRDSDVIRFTDGDCHVFARALNAYTGWPMYAFAYEWETGAWEPDLHAFCVYKNHAVDIEGAEPIESFRTRWSDGDVVEVKQFEWQSMRAFQNWGIPVHGPYSHRRAKLLAPIIAEKVINEIP